MPLTLDGSTGITFPNEGTITKAWVNFSGTGTIAIRADGNFSSLADNGVGDYTASYTTAFSDANYCATVTNSGNKANADTVGAGRISQDTVPSTSAIRVYSASANYAASNFYDPLFFCIDVVR